jgi:hypothetical protein
MVHLEGLLPALRETLPGVHKFCESKFYTVAHNIFSIIVRLFPNNRLTGHSRILDPQYGTCFMSPFRDLEF